MNPIYSSRKPDGFTTMNSYLFVEDPLLLISFLKSAFYAEEINRVLRPESGDIANCILKIGDTCFMISQATGPFMKMRTSFYLYVNDVDTLFAHALQNGAVSVFEPADMDFGDRQGGVEDPCGNYWWISQRLVNSPYQHKH